MSFLHLFTLFQLVSHSLVAEALLSPVLLSFASLAHQHPKNMKLMGRTAGKPRDVLMSEPSSFLIRQPQLNHRDIRREFLPLALAEPLRLRNNRQWEISRAKRRCWSAERQ